MISPSLFFPSVVGMDQQEITGVAWAVSVEIDVVGPHLQSYSETKRVVDTLRLCNRFGKGNEAFVTRLPAGVLELVVHRVRWRDLESNIEKWSRGRRCCEDICHTLEHWTGEELMEMHEEFGLLPDCDCENEEQFRECKMLCECLEDQFAGWFNVHTERQDALHDMIRRLSSKKPKVSLPLILPPNALK